MTEGHSSTTKKLTNIDTVLVPTDFSDESHKALHYASALVRELRADLHVVHVGEIDFAVPGPALLGANPLSSDTEEAGELKRQLKAVIGKSISVAFHGRTGRAFDQIVRFARELEADLIVMSTHGRTGLKRLFLGSNAERVVQHSSSPVLVVRRGEGQQTDDAQPFRIQTILVPTDFSASSQEGLEYAVTFARLFGARLVLFHSFTIPEVLAADPYATGFVQVTAEEARTTAEDQMSEFARSADFGGLHFDTHVTMGPAAEAICDYAAKQHADLIITSTHGRTGFMHVLIGSVAEHVIRYARSPVLVVPASVKKVDVGVEGKAVN
jgi:nucleotide-binding universal stress UspA family protein